MEKTSLKYFSDFTIKYLTDHEFAACIREFIFSVEGMKAPEKEDEPKSMTLDDRNRIAFVSAVDLFCSNMKEKMSGENVDVLKKAILYAFDNDKNGAWFQPRSSCKETFNVESFCRLQYHLHSNGFYDGATCCGHPFAIEDIAHMIIGQETCDANAPIDCKKSVIIPNSKKHNTIVTYIRRNGCRKSFENFCQTIIPENFKP